MASTALQMVLVTTFCWLSSNRKEMERSFGTVTRRYLLESRLFDFPKRPDRPWGPHNNIIKWYRRNFHRWYSVRTVKFTTNLHVVQRLRMRGATPHLPLYAFVMDTNIQVLAVACRARNRQGMSFTKANVDQPHSRYCT